MLPAPMHDPIPMPGNDQVGDFTQLRDGAHRTVCITVLLERPTMLKVLLVDDRIPASILAMAINRRSEKLWIKEKCPLFEGVEAVLEWAVLKMSREIFGKVA